MLNYLIATDPLPPIRPGILYEYILAGNGVFIRGARREDVSPEPAAAADDQREGGDHGA